MRANGGEMAETAHSEAQAGKAIRHQWAQQATAGNGRQQTAYGFAGDDGFEAAAGHEEEARHSAPAKGCRYWATTYNRAGSGVVGRDWRRLAAIGPGLQCMQLRGTEEGNDSHREGSRSTAAASGLRLGGRFFSTRFFHLFP